MKILKETYLGPKRHNRHSGFLLHYVWDGVVNRRDYHSKVHLPVSLQSTVPPPPGPKLLCRHRHIYVLLMNQLFFIYLLFFCPSANLPCHHALKQYYYHLHRSDNSLGSDNSDFFLPPGPPLPDNTDIHMIWTIIILRMRSKCFSTNLPSEYLVIYMK